jgi:hypothetical protein
MTSEDIQKTGPTDLSTNSWLKLIALQLSVLIESLAAQPAQTPPVEQRRGPGRPPKVH